MRRLLIALVLLAGAGSVGLAAEIVTVTPFHVMVVNDDGVDAPGIAALVGVLAADPAYRVTVVAPAEPQSGMGHALVIHGEIEVRRHADLSGCPAWAVAATPASVSRLGITALLADDQPALVLSGINKGENSGRIAWYSGTVGAAREAVLAGVPAIAFSLQLDWENPQPDFAGAARLAKPVVDAVREHGLPRGVYLNVNIPMVPAAARGYQVVAQSVAPDQLNRYELVREEDGVSYYSSRWFPPAEQGTGTDNTALDKGMVSIVPLGIDATDYRALPQLEHLDLELPEPAPAALPAAAASR